MRMVCGIAVNSDHGEPSLGPFPHDAARPDQRQKNPAGTDGFEFVRFTGPEPEAMISRLELMGFTPTHVNPANGVVR